SRSASSRCAISGMWATSEYGPTLGRPARAAMKASYAGFSLSAVCSLVTSGMRAMGSLSSAGRSRARGLQIGFAALLEQPVHAAVEVLHAEAEELGDEIVGAAAPGDAPGAGDRLHAALDHRLHVGMRHLAGVAHRLRE